MRTEEFRPITPRVDVVIPTDGRESLGLLLASIDGPPDRLPRRVILVDRRRSPHAPLPTSALSPELRARLVVVTSDGLNRAAARNLGWQASRAPWIAFLDDDVVLCRGWLSELRRDLTGAAPDVAGIRGRVLEPPSSGGSRSEPELDVERPEYAAWSSGDVAYRTSVLRGLGGFDERLASAGRDDDDLTIRAARVGLRLVAGARTVVHPAWPASPWSHVQAEGSRADDVLMRVLHGSRWLERTAVPASVLVALMTTMAGIAAAIAAALGHSVVAAGGLLVWLVGTVACSRRLPDPSSPAELAATLATSMAIAPAAVWHQLVGELRAAVPGRRVVNGRAATVEISPPPAGNDVESGHRALGRHCA